VHFAAPGRHRSLRSCAACLPTLPEFVAIYGLLYAESGVQSPFLPAFLREQVLHPEEIGIILAASAAMRVLAARGGRGRAGATLAMKVLAPALDEG